MLQATTTTSRTAHALAAAPHLSPVGRPSPRVRPLTDGSEAEVLAFLSKRPVHTVNLSGFIRDNGLVSPLNRGAFYAYRNEQGQLEGVALIGHVTLFEALTPRAVAAFARLARRCERKHILLGEQEKIEQFWRYYTVGGQPARLACRELLVEWRGRAQACEEVSGLRLATPDDLELVMPVQAQLAFDESQINPLEKDPVGFRERCARRIARGRTWVWVEEGRLIFKADIINETPDVTYLEGVWVNPQERGRGLGLRCMSQLSRTLLRRTKSLILFINEDNQTALSFYRKSGYETRGCYDTIFF